MSMMMTIQQSQTKAKALILSTFYGTYSMHTHTPCSNVCMYVMCKKVKCNARQCSTFMQCLFPLHVGCPIFVFCAKSILQLNMQYTKATKNTHIYALNLGQVIRTISYMHGLLIEKLPLFVPVFQFGIVFSYKIIAIYMFDCHY